MRHAAVSVLAVAASGVIASRLAEPVSSKACVSFWGPQSAVHAPEFVLAADEDQWLEIWARHEGKDPEDYGFRRIGVPEIDFSRFIVVGYFRGEAINTDGEIVEAVEVINGATRIRFDSLTYQTGDFGPGPREPEPKLHPFGLWVIPKTSGPVRIEENVQGIIGRPPIWKLQHEFPALRATQPR